MNPNRGQYNATPLYNLKKRSNEKKGREQQAASLREKRYKALSVVMSLVLPALFLLSLLIPNNPLRWLFLAVSCVSVLAMWALRAFVKSARNTLTVIYAALAVVIGLALFINRQAPEARNLPASRQDPSALFTNPDVGAVNAMLNEMATEPPEENAQEQEAVSEAQNRLDAFFQAWARNSVSEMLKICVPSWVSQQQSPEATLFQMLSRSRPTSYTIEDISGSDGNASRIVTLKASFDENGASSVKRMHVMMHRINEAWYVNPDSLDGVPVDEAAELAARQSYQMVASTIAPTAVPATSGSGIVVYYNEKGGKYYHAERTCTAVDSQYWPLTEFSFDLINSQQFKSLIRCHRCNPPERPSVGQ